MYAWSVDQPGELPDAEHNEVCEKEERKGVLGRERKKEAGREEVVSCKCSRNVHLRVGRQVGEVAHGEQWRRAVARKQARAQRDELNANRCGPSAASGAS